MHGSQQLEMPRFQAAYQNHRHTHTQSIDCRMGVGVGGGGGASSEYHIMVGSLFAFLSQLSTQKTVFIFCVDFCLGINLVSFRDPQ